MTADTAIQNDIQLDPLRGAVFRLSDYIQLPYTEARPKNTYGYQGNMDYTISMSRILVGAPPDNTLSEHAHHRENIVIVSGLSPSSTDAQIKRDCIESLGRPRFIYMHVGDVRTGVFSGTCVIEFWDEESAVKACNTGVLSQRARPVTHDEFESLSKGEWPMLEYGPARGVFSLKPTPTPSPPPAAAPSWSNRPPVANPWQ